MTMAQACKRRYDLLRIRRRCVECTSKLPRRWDKVRCPFHHSAQLAYGRKWRKERNTLAERVTALEVAVSALKRTPSSHTLLENPTGTIERG